MQIVVRGKVTGKMFEVKRLIDSKDLVIARLYGDWVERYVGQELGIVALNEQTKPWFEFMAKILNGVEEEMKGTEVGPRGIDKRKTARLLEGAICRRDCDLWDSELDQCEDIESRAECLGITEAVIIALQKEEG